MIIDCERCAARPSACDDCVVGVLLSGRAALGAHPGESRLPPGAPALSLDAPERRALDVLAEQGLVPRLRLVSTRTHAVHNEGTGEAGERDAG